MSGAARRRPPAPPRVSEPEVAAHLTPWAGALPDGGTVTSADLGQAELTVLEEVQIETSSLDRARAGGAHWERTSLVDCRLDGADLANLRARDLALTRCALRESRLVGGQLVRSRLQAVQLENVAANLTSWHESTWRHVVLRGCDLREADLTGAALSDVLFDECDLAGAQLSGVRCERVRLTGCRLSGLGGVEALRGASVGEADAVELLPAMARAMGIRIEE